jgi:hypothetical protein
MCRPLPQAEAAQRKRLSAARGRGALEVTAAQGAVRLPRCRSASLLPFAAKKNKKRCHASLVPIKGFPKGSEPNLTPTARKKNAL